MKIRIVILILLSSASAFAQQPITGFDKSSLQRQWLLEKQFDTHLQASSIGHTIRRLSSKPHHLGSPGGREVADSILQRFIAYGWQARIDTFLVLFPTPYVRELEMTAPKKYKPGLKEPALPQDATSGQRGQLPTYNAWSADGDVTAPLVFVNYGLPADYEWLERRGVDVKGKIVIAKYGRSWRGIKPKLAQEHGAVGCIIYSDPADDGYGAGDVYPEGAYRNQSGVQRGSVMDMPVYPGDPLTPGQGSTRDAKRIDRATAKNLLNIPVLPISYGDARPMLEALRGPMAPDDWNGGLPFRYHIGDASTKVHLRLSFHWDIVPCYDVVARIEGFQYPDQWILRGNHHDAWVNGANDPISGQAVLLEEAKAIGALVKAGWKPKRTLVYIAWDGEEPALLGSTEYVENNIDELRKKAVVYINSDANGRGYLSAGGSHALQDLVNEVAAVVPDPQTHVSVRERLLARNTARAVGVEAKEKALSKKDIDLYALGSGSDYSPFIQHAGVPSLNIEFGGEDGGGEYHSVYDSYDHYRRFKDPGFVYGVTLAQTIGRVVMRLADAEQLPFRFHHLSSVLDGYLAELQDIIGDSRKEAALQAKMASRNVFALAADTADHLKVLVPEQPVPFIDFSSLQNALDTLRKVSDSLDRRLDSNLTDALNTKLYQAEQQLLLPEGLLRREWYRHAIYAPGFYTGYGVKTMPGIREAIEQRNWKEAQQEILRVAAAVRRLSAYLSND